MPALNAHCGGSRSHGVNLLKCRSHAILIQWSYVLLPRRKTVVDIGPFCEGIANRHGELSCRLVEDMRIWKAFGRCCRRVVVAKLRNRNSIRADARDGARSRSLAAGTCQLVTLFCTGNRASD